MSEGTCEHFALVVGRNILGSPPRTSLPYHPKYFERTRENGVARTWFSTDYTSKL